MAPLRSRLRKTENKNSTQTATFLRLAIVASSPIANRGTKNAGNLPCEGPFFALRGQGRVRNRKKVAEMPSFYFHDGWIISTGRFHDGRIASTGGYRNGRITATGQITQMCVFSAAARVATSRATDRTKRPLGLAGLGWAAARVQRGLLRIGRSGSP